MINEVSEKLVRYHGFTCPKCGSHNFGTHTHRILFMGNKYPEGTKVGKCQENQHSGNGCTFEWDRGDPVTEGQCMYTQTHEEWMAQFKSSLPK